MIFNFISIFFHYIIQKTETSLTDGAMIVGCLPENDSEEHIDEIISDLEKVCFCTSYPKGLYIPSDLHRNK